MIASPPWDSGHRPGSVGGARFRSWRFATAVLAACGVSGAQTSWTYLGTLPQQTNYAPMAYDSVRDRVVAAFPLIGTWEFDGVAWTQASTSPSAYWLFRAMAYDPVRQRTLAQDGRYTFEWDGANWSQRAVQHHLSGFAFHAGRGHIMAFSDLDGRDLQSGMAIPSGNDLWEWDGTNWSVVPTANAPPVLLGHPRGYFLYGNLGYDPARDRLYMHGRLTIYTQSSVLFPAAPETWEWDVTNGWILSTRTGPSYYSSGAAFDVARSKLVVVWNSGLAAQVSEWDVPSPWRMLGGSNPLGNWQGPVPVYDSLRNRILVLDGQGGLWAYGAVHAARYEQHGNGCPGPLGSPVLGLLHAWTLPWLGGSLALRLDGVPAGLAVLSTSFSDQVAGSTALPFSLAGHGMPGCLLRAAPDSNMLLAGSGISVTASLPHPGAVPQLLGLQFFQQALVPSPAGGAAMSNSMRGLVGQR